MRDRFCDIYTKFIKRPGSDELMKWLERSSFFTDPASTRFHGAYAGGLCEHSVNVWEEFVRLLKAYPEIKANGESVAIVSLLHDLCKVGSYQIEFRNKKIDGVWRSVPTYSFNEGFCYGGHGSKSVFRIQKYMSLTDEEAVAINCHMAAWDRCPTDYTIGNAFEQHPFAWLLHVADESATYIRESKIKEDF